jgi:hypothetical protein
MQKSVKIYLAFCMICLQILSPFIHAHAFGSDSFKEHVFHVHAAEINPAFANNQSAKPANVSEQAIVGTIVTVSSGIKQAFADDTVFMAILFTLALLLFNTPNRLISSYFQTANYQRHAYSLLPARAPPH